MSSGIATCVLAPAMCAHRATITRSSAGTIEITFPQEFHVSEPESLMNKGLDDWFRWLHWFMETGTLFEASRVYVHRIDPERYVYLYGELAQSE